MKKVYFILMLILPIAACNRSEKEKLQIELRKESISFFKETIKSIKNNPTIYGYSKFNAYGQYWLTFIGKSTQIFPAGNIDITIDSLNQKEFVAKVPINVYGTTVEDKSFNENMVLDFRISKDKTLNKFVGISEHKAISIFDQIWGSLSIFVYLCILWWYFLSYLKDSEVGCLISFVLLFVLPVIGFNLYIHYGSFINILMGFNIYLILIIFIRYIFLHFANK